MLTQEQVEIVVGPHKGDIFECLKGGATDYGADYTKRLQSIHSSRSKATIRHDHIVERVKKRFDNKPGVATKEVQQLFLLVISRAIDDAGTIGTVAIRFHKLDDDRKCGNATQQTMRFYNQAPIEDEHQEETPGISSTATHLVAAYEMNKLGTSVTSTLLSCPKAEGSYAWHMTLSDEHVLAPVVELASQRAQQSDKKAKQVRGAKESTKPSKKQGGKGGKGGADS